jgi:poly(3-hydroxyalkanoate) synthetase
MQKFERVTETIIKNDVYSLHYFAPDRAIKYGLPCFVVPPHAGRHGNIAQKMIDTCVKNCRPTYTVELHSATHTTRDTSIQDLVNMLYDCQSAIIDHNNTYKVDLICLCQGAWLGAIYTARHQHRVDRYANFAGPINTKTGEDNIIEKYCSSMNIGAHEAVVLSHGGIQPGYLQWLSFSMVSSYETYVGRWISFATAIMKDDEEEIKKQKRNNDWYDCTMDLAGNWFLDCL